MDKETFRIEAVDAETEKKLLGIWGWLLRGEKREALLTSKLVKLTLKKIKESGQKLTKEEIDKIRFAHDPVFRQRVINKIHRDSDWNYKKNIWKCEFDIRTLEKNKADEISKIEKSRWEKIAVGNLKYNITEGKLLLNGNPVLFSKIKGASVKIAEFYSVKKVEEGESTKHASVGGAVAGGLLMGPIGAVIGATALGTTTHEGTSDTKRTPMVSRVWVAVDLDGFQSDIVLLSKTVEQNSKEFQKANKDAQEIVSKLQYLASLPVPENYLKAEEEPSVLKIQEKILLAHKALETAKAEVPTYKIPERYL